MEKIENKFSPYEESLRLKQLGFYEECFGFYSPEHNNNFISGQPEYTSIFIKNGCLCAPLWQQAFDWFREEHKLWSMVYPRDGWNFTICRIDENTDCTAESYHGTEFKTYEEAHLECLKKLIEIVEQQIKK